MPKSGNFILEIAAADSEVRARESIGPRNHPSHPSQHSASLFIFSNRGFELLLEFYMAQLAEMTQILHSSLHYTCIDSDIGLE